MESWRIYYVSVILKYMPTDDPRERSKKIFGNGYMLEVCARIARANGRVCLTSLIPEDLVPSQYHSPIKRLVDAGLLIPSAEVGDDRRSRWYRPVDSKLWRAAEELEVLP